MTCAGCVGHGPVLTTDEARAIGVADPARTRLAEVAEGAVARRRAPRWALLEVYEVEPPRPPTPDFEIYGLRTGNARLAVAEAQARLG